MEALDTKKKTHFSIRRTSGNAIESSYVFDMLSTVDENYVPVNCDKCQERFINVEGVEYSDFDTNFQNPTFFMPL